MDDLNQQIAQILGDPQKLQQIQSMAAALGLGGNQTSEPQPAPTQEQNPLSEMLSTQSSQPMLNADVLQAVGKLAPLLSRVRQEDDSTRLLRALRPLLSPPRQKKLDEAIKILQMMRLMPLLQNGGLSGLL